jgi:hypothetical protein
MLSLMTSCATISVSSGRSRWLGGLESDTSVGGLDGFNSSSYQAYCEYEYSLILKTFSFFLVGWQHLD